MNKKRTPQEKIGIMMEFFNTNISTAELCCKHNVSPVTLQDWKNKFLDGGSRPSLDEVMQSRTMQKK